MLVCRLFVCAWLHVFSMLRTTTTVFPYAVACWGIHTVFGPFEKCGDLDQVWGQERYTDPMSSDAALCVCVYVYACCVCRAVAVDMRGYGESDKPSGVCHYTLDKLVSDIDQLISALGVYN